MTVIFYPSAQKDASCGRAGRPAFFCGLSVVLNEERLLIEEESPPEEGQKKP